MSIVTKVKNKDDFGKRKIGGNVYEYSHHYPRMAKNDFLIYYYPENRAIGIYQVTAEEEFYEKDGFQYCRGRMARYEKSAAEFVDFIKERNAKLATQFETIIMDLINKN